MYFDFKVWFAWKGMIFLNMSGNGGNDVPKHQWTVVKSTVSWNREEGYEFTSTSEDFKIKVLLFHKINIKHKHHEHHKNNPHKTIIIPKGILMVASPGAPRVWFWLKIIF